MEYTSPDRYDSDGESLREEDLEVKEETSPSSQPDVFSPIATNNKAALAVKHSTNQQKRRRVTRCRRKKIKCDGKQPCTHCTVYSYECTYDQPSNRRRNPAPQYVENLEQRVHRAEALLHLLAPNIDLNDPGLEAAVAQGWIPGAPSKGRLAQAQEQRPQKLSSQARRSNDNKPDTNIESMVRAVAQIDMDETGNWDYHGHSSGLSFVRRMREQLGDLLGPDTQSTPFVKSRPMSVVLDSPKSSAESPLTGDSFTSTADIPPKHIAQELCRSAVDQAAALMRHIHRPTFWQAFERLYSVPPEQYTDADHRFLPLFHSALALGHLFGKDEYYESAIQEGFVHFKTARHLTDIVDCRGLMSLQAVVMMILFLQSSAKLAQCYAYIGVALRSAVRMGLHRNYHENFDPVESETRKRVFWTVRKMDIYVGAMLGLPQMLTEEDIDQDFPAEVDDEYITRDAILPMPEGQISIMTAFNAHTRLVQLLSKIVRVVYPIKVQGKPGSGADLTYSVPFSTIREIESEMEDWKNRLPAVLNPSTTPGRFARVQQLLRLSYAHTQVMLYRPFLHFVSSEKRAKPVDQRAYACAVSYVNVSRNMIHILTHMKNSGMLNGAFWFIMYTSFFAVLSLVYFAAENPDHSTTQAVMKDALEGKEVLASLSKRSMAADRCTATLNVVFQRLPEWMRNGQQNPTINRKRTLDADLKNPGLNTSATRSNTELSTAGRSEPGLSLQRRAGTFPRLGGTNGVSPTSYDAWSQSGSSTIGPQTPTTGDFQLGGYMNYNPLSASNAFNQRLHGYPIPQSDHPNPAISDLSTMMFPASDEPFGYPNQPLTTFENNQQFGKDSIFANSQPFGGVDSQALTDAKPPSRGREDNMEAQFFALPPYLDQRRQQEDLIMNYNNGSAEYPGQHMGTPTATSQMPEGWPDSQPTMHQGEMSNINIQDIFGGTEWNPMLMNPFQQQ